ncbi:MAG: zf-HC2 domain-containing protein [Planctomycetaceae bacterium]
MNCTQARRLIQLHVGDDLTHTESQLLESHLLKCGDCRNQQTRMLRPMAALHALRDATPEPSPSVWPSVSRSILTHIRQHQTARRFNLQVAAVSVCSLLLAVVTIVQTLQSLRPAAANTTAYWMPSQAQHQPAQPQPFVRSVASFSHEGPYSSQPQHAVNWPHGAQDF